MISDAYVAADYDNPPYQLAPDGCGHGVFTFHVASSTVLPRADGQSPFSTVCAMLYSGRPGTLTPSRNRTLETTQARLVRGRGIPNYQP